MYADKRHTRTNLRPVVFCQWHDCVSGAIRLSMAGVVSGSKLETERALKRLRARLSKRLVWSDLERRIASRVKAKYMKRLGK